MTPGWHDYPTGPGDWRVKGKYHGSSFSYARSYDHVMTCYEEGGQLLSFGVHSLRAAPPERTDKTRKIRYYGPLPHDPQDQEETN